MTAALAAAAWLAAAVASATLAHAPRPGPFDGFGRGVHVFGEYVVDLGWGAQYWDELFPMRTSRLLGVVQLPSAEICNTPELFCVRSSDRGAPVQIVVPRRCRAMKVGEMLSAGGVRTVVLSANAGRSPPTVDHPYPDGYLLAAPERTDVVLDYDGPDGVVGFHQAQAPGVDLREVARRGDLHDPAPLVQGRPAWRYLRLVSPDTFAACEGSGYLLGRG